MILYVIYYLVLPFEVSTPPSALEPTTTRADDTANSLPLITLSNNSVSNAATVVQVVLCHQCKTQTYFYADVSSLCEWYAVARAMHHSRHADS